MFIGAATNYFIYRQNMRDVTRYFCHLVVSILFVLGLVCNLAVNAQMGDRTPASTGKLRVFAPAGMVGDEYWIYVNGRIASRPPHGTPGSTRRDLSLVPRFTNGISGAPIGWEVWNVKGFVLRMSGEDTAGIDRYISNNSGGDPAHIFQPIDLTLRPGTYIIELVISSPGSEYWRFSNGREDWSHSHNNFIDFPFIVTRKYEMDVHAGKTFELYIAVPDYWRKEDIPRAQLANIVCNPNVRPGTKPDRSDIESTAEKLFIGYNDDPMVKLLHKAAATGARPDGYVVLDLPADEGGSREFDGLQLQRITDRIASNHHVPSHSEVEECRQVYPNMDIDLTLDSFNKIIDRINKDIYSLRRFAAEINRGNVDY